MGCYFRVLSRIPLLEKTLHSVFVKDTMNNVTCSLPTVAQQARCFADPGIHDVMRHAIQLVDTCRESFMYEPWQCTTSMTAFKKGTNLNNTKYSYLRFKTIRYSIFCKNSTNGIISSSIQGLPSHLRLKIVDIFVT